MHGTVEQAGDDAALAVAEIRLAVAASMKGRCNLVARRRPILLLPAPINPTSTMLREGAGRAPSLIDRPCALKASSSPAKLPQTGHKSTLA
jgi:hypothetical protein